MKMTNWLARPTPGRAAAALAFAFVLALPAAAQIYPGPMPGSYPGGYPPGGYPPGGVYPPGVGGGVGIPWPHKKGKKQDSDNPDDTQKTTGVISEKKKQAVLVQTQDKRVFTFKVDKDTKYTDASGTSIALADLTVGDRVEVSSTQDDKGHYLAQEVKIVKDGGKDNNPVTVMNRSASGAPAPPPPPPPDEDAPRLHRTRPASASPDAAPADATAAPAADDASSAPPAAPASASQAPADSNTVAEAAPPPTVVTRGTPDPDDDAPRLHRGKPTADPHAHDLEREVAADAAAPPPANTTTVAQANAAQANAAQANAAQANQSQPQQTSGSYSDSSQPPPPPRSSDPRVALIQRAHDAAFEAIEKLPNFTCDQVTTRYISDSRPIDWHAQDVVTAKVIYEDGKESYQNIAINGRPSKDPADSEQGAWSSGEFGTVLRDLFEPSTAAAFHYATETQIHGLSAAVYDYSVDQPHSHWRIQASGQSFDPPYRGSIWVDKREARALRIESQAVHLPKDFPLDTAETAVDYDFVAIGTLRVLLPVRSEVLMCQRGSLICSRNVIEFRNYHKFGADSTVKFGQ